MKTNQFKPLKPMNSRFEKWSSPSDSFVIAVLTATLMAIFISLLASIG